MGRIEDEREEARGRRVTVEVGANAPKPREKPRFGAEQR